MNFSKSTKEERIKYFSDMAIESLTMANKLNQIEKVLKEATGEDRPKLPIFEGLVCRGDILGNGNGCRNCPKCDWHRENPIAGFMSRETLIKRIYKIISAES